MEDLAVFGIGILCTSVFPLGLVLLALGASRRLWPFGTASVLTWVLALCTAFVAWVWAGLMLPVWLMGGLLFVPTIYEGSVGFFSIDQDRVMAVLLAAFLVAHAAWLCALGGSVLLSGLQGSLVFRLWTLCTVLCGVLWLLPLGNAYEHPLLLVLVVPNLIFLVPCELGLVGLLVNDIGTSVRHSLSSTNEPDDSPPAR